MSEFEINEEFFLEASFDGSPQTPVQAVVLPPNADSTDGPFNMSAVGDNTFRYTYTASAVGLHHWKATTDDGAVKQGTFEVDPDKTDV
jgi:hypothetical protein